MTKQSEMRDGVEELLDSLALDACAFDRKIIDKETYERRWNDCSDQLYKLYMEWFESILPERKKRYDWIDMKSKIVDTYHDGHNQCQADIRQKLKGEV